MSPRVAPTRLAPDHDPKTCSDCRAASRDMQRYLAKLERTCRCCGVRIPDEHTVYIVGSLDVPACIGDWRMCGSCWRAGYQAGETIDSINQGRGAT